MKKLKKIFVSLIAFSLILGMNVMPVSAEGYTYKVTLHAGNKGAINGVEGGMEVQDGLYAGAMVSFDLSKVTVTDDRYYIKGVRLSGRDNDEVATAFYLDGDADYVVAYGVKGDMVGYTVNYQDADGNTLAPSATFYGNIGDKPVVAYKYITNYIPQALALTKTLSDNEAENVFTFVYHPADPESITIEGEGTTTIVTVQGQTGTATPGTGAAGTTGNEPGTAGTTTDQPGTAGENVEVTEPEELVDLDENETPAADLNLNKDEAVAKGFPMAVAAIIGGGALIALIILLLIVRKRIKSQ